MKRRTLLVALFIILPLLALAARSLIGVTSPPAEAVAIAAEGPANAELIGSSQSWKIVSKADFDADRVVIHVGKTDGTPKQVRSAVFVCENGDSAEVLHPKDDQKDAGPGNEIWSVTFPNKCIQPGGSVNVTLVPLDPHNKLTIKEASVQNTGVLVPREDEINAEQIHHHPLLWKITPKDAKPFNRVDIEVGRPGGQRVVLIALFACQHPVQVRLGEFKGVREDVQPDTTLPDHEVWSADFRRKCDGGVTVLLIPRRFRTVLVIKGGSVSNTNHPVPIEAPANPILEGKSQTFKITSKATFAANRVEVDVGSTQNTPIVASALFICADNSVTGVLKNIIKNANPATDPLPNHEVWSGELTQKWIPPAGHPPCNVTVTLVPVDPNTQLVIKKARVQNTTKPPTGTPTPASFPTPSGTNGSCVAGDQGVDLPHNTDNDGPWDVWKCFPSNNVDWDRVDILVGKPDQEPKVKSVQFDCQSNDSKANTISFKGHVKTATQAMELWSGEGFKETLPDGTVISKNCHGPVTVLLAMHDPDNHPPIKKAFFSHTGLPKPTPVKPTTNGHCDPVDPVAPNDWACTPDAAANVPPFNRIDIKVASPTAYLELSDLRAICLATGEPAVIDLKGQKDVIDNGGNVLSRHELWSGHFEQKCQGVVSVTLRPFVAGGTPQIIGVTFSNVGGIG